MVIREMSREECLRLLAVKSLYRLACSLEDQPYIVPVYLAYDERTGCLGGFAIPGQKIDWMRANPRVCVETDRIASYDRWTSVVVFGRYEELPETPRNAAAQLAAPVRPVQARAPADTGPDGVRLGDIPEESDERTRVWRILEAHGLHGEAACAAWAAGENRKPTDPFIPIYFRIRIDRLTGHEAGPLT